jgi:hypothetical protein
MSIPVTIRAPRAKTVPRGDLIIASQFNIGVYRRDFLIVGRDGFGNEKWIAVECDGEKYHHETMAQCLSDREQDKYVRDMGIEVIR